MCLAFLFRVSLLEITFFIILHKNVVGANKHHIAEAISNQRTNGPVNAHLISWPSKAKNIQNLENIW